MKRKKVNLYDKRVGVIFRRLSLLTILVLSLVAYRLKWMSLPTLAFIFFCYCVLIGLHYAFVSIKKAFKKSPIRKILAKTIVHLFILTVLLFPHHVFAQEFETPPTRIIIPRIATNLPVFTARVAYNTWEVRTDGASYGEHTTYPGNVGNTVIFSHARPGLFQDLPNLQKGDDIHVFTEKDWFVYKVVSVEVVEPEKTDVIFSNNKYELTLFTCTGPNYSQRFVVKALLVSDPTNSF